ncbi:MAG: hypothetical protein H0V25_05900 [Solirubrobacterales bacterium]|nr:hypothetical protein [Solirubrobacterales bacterium]
MSTDPIEPTESTPPGSFVESLMDTDLYSMGAFFCDQHPDLIDEVVERSSEIERSGLSAYAAAASIEIEEAFGMLLTGLSVRYYKAVAG